MPDPAAVNPSRRLTGPQVWAYAAGYFSGALAFVVLSKIQYLYEGNPDAGLPRLVTPAMFVAVMVLGRLLDSVSDPLVGYLSDRTRSRWGRRKPWISVGMVPLLLGFMLLWRPPDAGVSALNGAWLLLILSVFFLSNTVVLAPYLAMLPEMSRNDSERNTLATCQALTNVLGLVAGSLIGLLVTIFGEPANPSHRFFWPGVVLALAAGGSLALTLAGQRELPPDETQAPSGMGLFATLASTRHNRPFLHFIGAFFMVWFAIQLLLGSLSHFPVARLGIAGHQNEQWNSILLGAALLSGAVCFPLVKRSMDRRGRAWTFGACMVQIAVTLPLLAVVTTPAAALLVLAIAGPGVGGVLVLPHAVLADVTDHDARQVGQRREAIYYGMQGLLTKLAVAASISLVSWLLAIGGNSADRPWGVVACPVLAAVCLLIGAGCFRGFSAALASGTTEES